MTRSLHQDVSDFQRNSPHKQQTLNQECVYFVRTFILLGKSTCLLDAKAEVEQAVGAVRLPVGPLHLGNEAAEAVAELSCGALEDIRLQHHQPG